VKPNTDWLVCNSALFKTEQFDLGANFRPNV
jgi:hypothetical protein